MNLSTPAFRVWDSPTVRKLSLQDTSEIKLLGDRKSSILVVDDNALMRGILKKMIEKLRPHDELSFAKNGLEAVTAATEKRPTLILMDLCMPKMDGLAATKKIRAWSGRSVQIIGCSSEPNAAEAFEQAGADGTIAKSERGVSRNVLRGMLIYHLTLAD